MKKLILILALTLGGCATLNKQNTQDALAKCMAADVLTTTFNLAAGGVEYGPIKALYIKGLGYTAGMVIPLIAVSVASYYFLDWLDQPEVTAVVAGATCYVAAHNVGLFTLP